MGCALSRLFQATLGIVSLATLLQGASADKPPERPRPPPPLANAQLAPSLKAAADRDRIALHALEPLSDELVEGDFTVAWVGASDPKGNRQWLIQFRRSTATQAEQTAARNREKKKYLSWGPTVTFKSDVQALDLWIAGPVTVGASAKSPEIAPVQRVRVLAPADYLQLGLDNSLRVDQHMHRRFIALRKADPTFKPSHIYALDKPIKPANIVHAKAVADRIQFTPEMERAWIGGFVALEAFYDLAHDVPAIRAIASVAIDRPSILKLSKIATGTHFVTSFGLGQTRLIDPATIGLIPVSTESFDAPFSFAFGDDPIVTGLMVVTKPMPPLDTTAGILAMIAVHPEDATRQVHIALISAVRGKGSRP